MKSLLTLMVMALAGMAGSEAMAQTQPSADVETVRSGIGEEQLAPIAVKKTVPAVASATVPVSGVASGVVAGGISGTAAVDPFVVKNVVVTLSGTTGFDRDAALEQAARQALPGVLVNMGMEAPVAAKTVKGLGSSMTFVKGFKVVKETLIPVYTLTSDLTFNGPMLQKNFGGKIPVAKPVVKAVVAGAEDVSETGGDEAVPAAQNTPVKQWVVRIAEKDPAQVDRVRLNLSKQASTVATYRLLTSNGAELVVDTPLSAADISRLAGHTVDVVELEVPLPGAAVQTDGTATKAWQGQAEPSEPGSPSAPNSPNAPASPNDPNPQANDPYAGSY